MKIDTGTGTGRKGQVKRDRDSHKDRDRETESETDSGTKMVYSKNQTKKCLDFYTKIIVSVQTIFNFNLLME